MVVKVNVYSFGCLSNSIYLCAWNSSSWVTNIPLCVVYTRIKQKSSVLYSVLWQTVTIELVLDTYFINSYKVWFGVRPKCIVYHKFESVWQNYYYYYYLTICCCCLSCLVASCVICLLIKFYYSILTPESSVHLFWEHISY